MDNVAVVVIDLQRDFLDKNADPHVGSWQKAFCVPGVRRLLAHARERGWDVIHVGTQHDDCGSLPPHQIRQGISVYCQTGTTGCEFVVVPNDGDEVVYKRWYSVFSVPEFDVKLSKYDIVIWAGVATDCCVQQSAFGADHRGIRTVVPIEAVSASSNEGFTASLTAIAKSAADVVDLDAILDARTLPPRGLRLEEVAEHARRWFADQEKMLGDADGIELDDVVTRLASG